MVDKQANRLGQFDGGRVNAIQLVSAQ